MSRDLFLPISAQPSIHDQVEYAVRADELGYERVWLAETWGRDAVTTLTTIAMRTDDIGIGTSISSVYSRSPALLGQTAATLDEASEKRFRLGVGQSAPPFNEMWHGIDHDRPLRRIQETIEIVRTVLSGEVLDYNGDIFDLSGFRLRFDPPSPPPRSTPRLWARRRWSSRAGSPTAFTRRWSRRTDSSRASTTSSVASSSVTGTLTMFG